MEIYTLLLLLIDFCLLIPSLSMDKNGPGVVRVVVEEGEKAILPCFLRTKENIENSVFDWKTDDEKNVFFYEAGEHYNNGRHGQDEHFSRRVFHFIEELKHGNASIWINNTKISDSGNYTCVFPHLPNRPKFRIELFVDPVDRDRSREIRGAARKPYVTTKVTEDGLLLLQCDVHDASPKPEVEWQDSAGNNLTTEEPQVIKRGDRYDVTLLTTVTKTDRFSCVVRQKEINHVISAEIYMPFSGAASKPYTKILDVTKDGLLLLCEVLDVSPKPEVEWQDSAGNILHAKEPQVAKRGDRFDVTLVTTVTKTDHFRCVVRQKEISHEISAETYVFVPEKQREHWAAWFFGGWGSGVLTVVAVLALLVATKFIRILRYKGSPPPQQMNGSCNGFSQVPLNPPHQNGNVEINGV